MTTEVSPHYNHMPFLPSTRW